jgi:predicted alpha/beta superfamily hydrolase
MNKKLSIYYVALLCLLFSQAMAQNTINIHVTFLLTAPTLSTDTAVYITGGTEHLGQWNPGVIRMEHAGNHTWRKTVTVSASSFEYKYTLGSWQHEGANAQGQSLSNFNITITHDTIISDTIQYWTSGSPQKTDQNTITGLFRYHHTMHGDNLAERDIVVWLPPDYNTDTARHYPVIYMQDGQNVFNAATSSFGVEWRMDEICDSLIKINAIPSVIVVGIYNTPDRSEEYAPGNKGTAYMHFMVNTLKPFIDSVYRTLHESKYTIVGGSSSGGLISFMLAWQYPQVFSKAICMSPALKISNLDYVKVVRASPAKMKHLFLYMDVGRVGLESRLAPGIHDMVAALQAKRYKEGSDFILITDPLAQHNESAWSLRLPYALKWCFSKM